MNDFRKEQENKTKTLEIPLFVGPRINGLTVLGCEPGCGKTVAMTGLAATLGEQGLAVRAIKPVVIGQRKAAESELKFISSITRTLLNYPVKVLASPMSVTEDDWQRAVNLAVQPSAAFTFVELPGSCATPLSLENSGGHFANNWKDSAELAAEFGYPCLLVSKHNFEAIDNLIVHANYLRARRLTIVGMMTSEVTADAGKDLESTLSLDQVALVASTRTGVPFLGCLRYSASISVSQVNQGNLIKTTENSIDILILRRALKLPVV